MIKIYTDGACSGNPGKGGWGAIIEKDGKITEIGGSYPHTTNNIMEMTAAIEGLKFVKDEIEKGTEIEIITDSQYLLNGITSWVHKWKKKGWILKKDQPVKNQEYWIELDSLNSDNIRWKWVKGHANNPYNNRVDQIAVGFSKGEKVILYSCIDSLEDVHKKEKKRLSNVYLSFIGGKLRIDNTWEDCESRVKEIPWAKYKKVKNLDEAVSILKKWKVAPDIVRDAVKEWSSYVDTIQFIKPESVRDIKDDDQEGEDYASLLLGDSFITEKSSISPDSPTLRVETLIGDQETLTEENSPSEIPASEKESPITGEIPTVTTIPTSLIGKSSAEEETPEIKDVTVEVPRSPQGKDRMNMILISPLIVSELIGKMKNKGFEELRIDSEGILLGKEGVFVEIKDGGVMEIWEGEREAMNDEEEGGEKEETLEGESVNNKAKNKKVTSEKVNKMIKYFRDYEEKWLRNFVKKDPVEFPENPQEWEHHHFYNLLRPFRKRMIKRWKHSKEGELTVIQDHEKKFPAFSINTAEEYVWETPPEDSIIPLLKKSAIGASVYEDRWVLSFVFSPDKGMVAVFFPMGRSSQQLALSRDWNILGCIFDELSAEEQNRIRSHFKYFLPYKYLVWKKDQLESETSTRNRPVIGLLFDGIVKEMNKFRSEKLPPDFKAPMDLIFDRDLLMNFNEEETKATRSELKNIKFMQPTSPESDPDGIQEICLEMASFLVERIAEKML